MATLSGSAGAVKHRWWFIILAWLVGLLGAPITLLATEATLAFPGAVGFGRYARGGRGGEVVAVTNLAGAGPGSLRAALSQRRYQDGVVEPRTVIFRVAGTITLHAPLRIQAPYLSIAGQTAPGGGIALRTTGEFDGPALIVQSHDVIIQHLRIRPARAPADACCGDGLAILNGEDVIIDHCSLSWASDEVLDIWYRSRRITVQRSIIAQARRDDPTKVSGKGLLIGDESDQVTLYGNLFAHQLQRSPLILSKTGGTFQVVNNVIYNWRHFGSEFLGSPGPAQVNVIGNTYRPGPETRPERYEILVGRGAQIFVKDNTGPRRPVNSLSDWDMVGHHRPHYNQPAPPTLQNASAFPGPSLPILDAADAYAQVLNSVGAILPTPDPWDRQLIREVREAQRSLRQPPLEPDQWPVLNAGVPYPDEDADGMDDRWERQQQLDPSDPNDRNLDPDGDGYTHLENFLHEKM